MSGILAAIFRKTPDLQVRVGVYIVLSVIRYVVYIEMFRAICPLKIRGICSSIQCCQDLTQLAR